MLGHGDALGTHGQEPGEAKVGQLDAQAPDSVGGRHGLGGSSFLLHEEDVARFEVPVIQRERRVN